MANPPPEIRWTIFVALALLALAVRLPQSGGRPMHTDETVNAFILGELLDGQTYRYDPQDKHGPLLFVLATPVARLGGAKQFSELTEGQLRLTPAIFGALTILLFGAGVRTFGFMPCLAGATVFAFAPMPVYYSRYFIHETLFVAATFGLMLAAWRMTQKKSLIAAALTGLCAALALASKETVGINFLALVITGCTTRLTGKWNQRQQSVNAVGNLPAETASHLSYGALAVVVGVFAIVSVMLFTWGGRHWQALEDLFRAVPMAAARAGGQGHEKAFHYYFGLLCGGWSGAMLMALALAGCRRAWLSRESRWLVTYAVSIVAIYSAIPYKTPWLALNLLLPLSILAGFAIEWAWSVAAGGTARSLVLLACGGIGALFAFDTSRLVFREPAAESNPYAYSHTIPDVLRLPGAVNFHADKLGITNPVIAVVAKDPWPLPWYLRQFPNVGYWQPGKETGAADFYITTTEPAADIAQVVQKHRPDYFGVRPNVLLILWSPTASSGSHE